MSLTTFDSDLDIVGCFLEVVNLRRLVFTDALHPGFRPAPDPFMRAVVSFEPQGSGSRYVATAGQPAAGFQQIPVGGVSNP